MVDYTTRRINNLNQLKPGDHIRVPGGGKEGNKGFKFSSSSGGSKGGIYYHHLLVVKVMNNRRVRVIHRTADHGVVEEELEINPEDVTVLDYDSLYMGDAAIRRARQIADGRYDLLGNNCEHFVFDVRTGRKKSEQIETVGKVILAFLVIVFGAMAMTRRPH